MFVADNARGIDVLRFGGGSGSPETEAPPGQGLPMPPMSRTFGYMCPVAGPGLRAA